MKTKVGSPGDDPERTRRFAIAIPSAVAITAMFVLLTQFQPADRPAAEQAPATTIVLEKAPPTPRPTPTPKPPPPPIVRPVVTVTIAPVPERAAPAAPRPIGGAHAAQRAIPRVAAPKTFAAPNAASGGGTDVAAGTGTGTGSGDSAGPGDAGGNGNVNADAPCGTVDIIPFQSPDRKNGAIYEHVQATITYPDGHKDTQEIPYPFIYRDADADPWSAHNMQTNIGSTPFQPPPPGANPARYSEPIRYILDHTLSNGHTTLQECPRLR
jgi:hypothetical protein